jgi:hypothetical protein
MCVHTQARDVVFSLPAISCSGATFAAVRASMLALLAVYTLAVPVTLALLLRRDPRLRTGSRQPSALDFVYGESFCI